MSLGFRELTQSILLRSLPCRCQARAQTSTIVPAMGCDHESAGTPPSQESLRFCQGTGPLRGCRALRCMLSFLSGSPEKPFGRPAPSATRGQADMPHFNPGHSARLGWLLSAFWGVGPPSASVLPVLLLCIVDLEETQKVGACACPGPLAQPSGHRSDTSRCPCPQHMCSNLWGPVRPWFQEADSTGITPKPAPWPEVPPGRLSPHRPHISTVPCWG